MGARIHFFAPPMGFILSTAPHFPDLQTGTFGLNQREEGSTPLGCPWEGDGWVGEGGWVWVGVECGEMGGASWGTLIS